jgi:hypothetical protein
MMAAIMPAGAMRRKRCAEHDNCLTWAHRARRLFPAHVESASTGGGCGRLRTAGEGPGVRRSAIVGAVTPDLGASARHRREAGPLPDNLAYRCPRGVTCKIR